ncbi:hypothetical protein [Allomuricauda sp.]|nr:hypothetical protein [Allomuricauda sp.]
MSVIVLAVEFTDEIENREKLMEELTKVGVDIEDYNDVIAYFGL